MSSVISSSSRAGSYECQAASQRLAKSSTQAGRAPRPASRSLNRSGGDRSVRPCAGQSASTLGIGRAYGEADSGRTMAQGVVVRKPLAVRERSRRALDVHFHSRSPSLKEGLREGRRRARPARGGRPRRGRTPTAAHRKRLRGEPELVRIAGAVHRCGEGEHQPHLRAAGAAGAHTLGDCMLRHTRPPGRRRPQPAGEVQVALDEGVRDRPREAPQVRLGSLSDPAT